MSQKKQNVNEINDPINIRVNCSGLCEVIELVESINLKM